MSAPDAPVLIIGGPTASGKSALAVDLAEAWGGIVVSADAMTVYRGLDVGTAKPGAADRARAPHRCLDLREPHEDFNVADFLAEVDAARATGRPVIVAGGTPFWLAALVRPLARLPEPDPTLRAELERIDDLHGALAAVDPESAARLHPHDRVRLVRALEVFRSCAVRFENGSEKLFDELAASSNVSFRDKALDHGGLSVMPIVRQNVPDMAPTRFICQMLAEGLSGYTTTASGLRPHPRLYHVGGVRGCPKLTYANPTNKPRDDT
jgi:tRNA A37 N6-isopentenylltransferase MiaA